MKRKPSQDKIDYQKILKLYKRLNLPLVYADRVEGYNILPKGVEGVTAPFGTVVVVPKGLKKHKNYTLMHELGHAIVEHAGVRVPNHIHEIMADAIVLGLSLALEIVPGSEVINIIEERVNNAEDYTGGG